MATQQTQLKKLEKFAKLDSTSARLLYIFNEYSALEDRVNQVVLLFKEQLDENSKIREEQIRELAQRVVVKGDKGDKPTKAELIALIKPLIPKPIPGKPGKNGKDAEVTEDVINEIAFSLESQLPPMIETHVGDALENLIIPPKKIDITKLNVEDLRLDASQIENLPESKTIIKNGGSSGLDRILSSGTTVRQGATEINFGNNLTVTRTPNGVKVDATGGGSSITVVTPTGTVNASNDTFTVASEPKWVVADGATYFDGAGYSYSGGTITMDLPPSNFIRAIL